MPIMRPIFCALILLGLVITGCTRSSDPQRAAGEASSVSAPATALLFCGKNERICTSCDGSRQFCGQFCPDCTPPLAPGDNAVPATLALLADPACADRI